METGALCDLGVENLKYIKSVLRKKKGDHLILFDGAGWEYETAIKDFSGRGINVEVLGKKRIEDDALRITLLQSLPKSNKMESIIQKATELGACRIIPFMSVRSIPRLTPDKARARVWRWRTIATEAARQCGRADMPKINDILSLEEALASIEGGALKIFFWEEETGRSIKTLLREKRCEGVRDVAVVVGPEGGFSKEEADNAVKKGFTSVSLGKNILKVETAAITILSIIQYEFGIFGVKPEGDDMS